MWYLSSYSHSLARLYRFRDPKTEQRYQVDMNKWSTYNTQLHYTMIIGFYALSSVSYFESPVLDASFYITVGITIGSLFWFINGVISPVVRRHRIFFFFLFCLLHLGALMALNVIQPEFWATLQFRALIPDDHRLVLEGPNGTKTAQADVFRRTIQSDVGMIEYLTILSFTEVAGLHLCLNGLSVWTILGHIATFAATVCSNASLGQPIENLVFSIIQRTLALVFKLALTTLIERMQRKKFLAEMLLEQQMQSAMTADSILNHMLKNTLADAAAYIELFLHGSSPATVLLDSVQCLRRGMKACKERQLYMKLVAGEYVPVQNAINLKQFGEQLVAGRGVRGEYVDRTVLFDSALVSLVLDNALSNAVKHGRPEDPDVMMAIHVLDDDLLSGGVRVEFLVTNAADPQRPPLTPDVVRRLFAGDRAVTRRAPVLSDGIGLTHSVMAAQAGGFAVSMQQDGDRVAFRVVIYTQDASDPSTLSHSGDSSSGPLRSLSYALSHRSPSSVILPLPPRLRFFILDDTAASRKILEHQIRSTCPTARVTAFGAVESDIDLFVARASEEADIVIVDQHLEYGESHLGTNALKRLALLGFSGLMCVRSGDNSDDDLEHYAASGAHCFLGKDLTGPETMERLAGAYMELFYGTGAECALLPPVAC